MDIRDNEVNIGLILDTFVFFRVNPLDYYLVITRTNRMLHTNNITSSRCKAMLHHWTNLPDSDRVLARSLDSLLSLVNEELKL